MTNLDVMAPLLYLCHCASRIAHESALARMAFLILNIPTGQPTGESLSWRMVGNQDAIDPQPSDVELLDLQQERYKTDLDHPHCGGRRKPT